VPPCRRAGHGGAQCPRPRRMVGTLRSAFRSRIRAARRLIFRSAGCTAGLWGARRRPWISTHCPARRCHARPRVCVAGCGSSYLNARQGEGNLPSYLLSSSRPSAATFEGCLLVPGALRRPTATGGPGELLVHLAARAVRSSDQSMSGSWLQHRLCARLLIALGTEPVCTKSAPDTISGPV